MTIGRFFRKVLGKHFQKIGKIYRSIFVDLSAVANSIESHIPQGSMVIDVGGGDGQPLNYLLSIRQDIVVKMLDISMNVGTSLQERYLARVERYPGIGMGEFSLENTHQPLVILISDVIHHIPVEARKDFFSDIRTMIGKNDEVRVIIKDVEPGYFRSMLGYLADRYISGDKKVSLVSRADISNMMLEAFGNCFVTKDTNLFELDKPNFGLVFVINKKNTSS